MILLGNALIERFEWILYLFGIFLVITGVKMFFQKEEGEHDLTQNPLLKRLRRWIPITENYEGNKFAVRKAGKLMLTPLGLALIFIEWTDLVFAVDSIPAIFTITTDSFIVYSSNICAIFGLRSLFFLLSGIMHYFTYLKAGLAIVLTFIGMKMLMHSIFPIDTMVSLMIVGSILGGSILLSVLKPKVE